MNRESPLIGHVLDVLSRIRPLYRAGFACLVCSFAVSAATWKISQFRSEALALDFSSAKSAQCVVQVVPGVGESTQLAVAWWNTLWSTYMCAFETVRSGVTQMANFWNSRAEKINETMENVQATKNALQAIKNGSDTLERQRAQIRNITNNIIIKNKDFTKVRINTLNADDLVVLKDMSKANHRIESIATSLGLQNDKSKEEWMESNEGRSLLNAIKARNDLVFEQTELKALKKELHDAERAAREISANDKDGADPLVVYERLTLPTMQKLAIVQTQIALLQTEISLRTYEATVLKKPIDKNPLGKSASEYYNKKLREYGSSF